MPEQEKKPIAGGGKESMSPACSQAKAAYRQLEAEYNAGISDSLISWEDFLSNRNLTPEACPR